MKSIFSQQDSEEMLQRINRLSLPAKRQWCKMELPQMLAHCVGALEMGMGKINPPRAFIGKLLGRFFRSNYSNDKPFPKESPTSDKLRISDAHDFETEKNKLRKCVQEFSAGGERSCPRHPHPFFGELTEKEWGIGMYKHLDHHLRQFGS